VTRFAIVCGLAVALAWSAARADTAHDVSRVRGLKIEKPIQQEIVDRAELRARLAKAIATKTTHDQLAAEGIALARWGFVPPVTDYAQLTVDVLGEQLAGYYDPETKKLTLLSPTAEFVLVHETAHALQDQHFDLAKVEAPATANADEALARHALVEGDALVTMLEVLLDRKGIAPPWSNPAIVADLSRALDVPVRDTLDAAPLAIREAKLFPYKAGFEFVAALRATKPWSAIDAAFKRPPVSTEQVLHPDKYLADEQPVTVEAPALEGATLVFATTWGELGLSLFLRAHGVDAQMAKQAAAGWAGDRVTTVQLGTHVVGLARMVFDSEIDAIEAYDAIERALDDSQLAARAEHTDARTRWLALDGTVSTIERSGTEVTIVLGAPISCCAAGTEASRPASAP
jgi:hypothetical protein